MRQHGTPPGVDVQESAHGVHGVGESTEGGGLSAASATSI